MATVALCCLGSSLVVLLGAAGVSAWLGLAGAVLVATAAVPVLLAAGYAGYRHRAKPDREGRCGIGFLGS